MVLLEWAWLQPSVSAVLVPNNNKSWCQFPCPLEGCSCLDTIKRRDKYLSGQIDHGPAWACTAMCRHVDGGREKARVGDKDPLCRSASGRLRKSAVVSHTHCPAARKQGQASPDTPPSPLRKHDQNNGCRRMLCSDRTVLTGHQSYDNCRMVVRAMPGPAVFMAANHTNTSGNGLHYRGRWGIFGWGKFWVGKFWAPPNFGALCTVAGTTIVGIHSGYTKNPSGVHRILKKICFGYALASRLILTCNSRAPVPPYRMLAANPGSKKWPGLRKQFRGAKLGTNLKNEISAPCNSGDCMPSRL